jgi:hypothetical protein
MSSLPTPPPQEAQDIFPSSPPTRFCSWCECLGGHRWAATLVVVPCGGCKCGVVALKKENCPYCNEPVSKISLRSDHLPKGGGMAQRCLGQPVNGETLDIVLEKHAWKEAQEQATLFLEREALKEVKSA